MCKKLARLRFPRKPSPPWLLPVHLYSRESYPTTCMMAPTPKEARSASMALQASAPDELRGALGRLAYLCATGGKAMFVAAADLSMLQCTLPSAADHQIVDRGSQSKVARLSSIPYTYVCTHLEACRISFLVRSGLIRTDETGGQGDHHKLRTHPHISFLLQKFLLSLRTTKAQKMKIMREKKGATLATGPWPRGGIVPRYKNGPRPSCGSKHTVNSVMVYCTCVSRPIEGQQV